MTAQEKIYDFMGWRKAAAILSALLIVASIISLSTRGLAFGLDFTGGTLVEVGYAQAADLNQIRNDLEQAGYEDAVVVNFGSDKEVLVRLARGFTDTLGAELLEVLRGNSDVQVDLRRIEFVGPQVGEELRDQGGLAMLTALGMIMLYIAFRFQFKFSVGAVAALAHDVIITLGLFSIMQWDFDLTVLAALLAVIGYSLNDTIVVSDRIRENFRKLRKGTPVDVINHSLTQTLSRTLITSLTTMLVLWALLIFGGEIIHGFAQALIAGVVIGTYSSIYVAANMLLAQNIDREDLMVPVKEGEEFDERP